ncbi:hypothetical protein Hdeb2414_s0013g00414021 [Helianthus debilis subsp. tardiflorus]
MSLRQARGGVLRWQHGLGSRHVRLKWISWQWWLLSVTHSDFGSRSTVSTQQVDQSTKVNWPAVVRVRFTFGFGLTSQILVWFNRFGSIIRFATRSAGQSSQQNGSGSRLGQTESTWSNLVNPATRSTRLTRSTQLTFSAKRHEILVKSIGAINNFVISIVYNA